MGRRRVATAIGACVLLYPLLSCKDGFPSPVDQEVGRATFTIP